MERALAPSFGAVALLAAWLGAAAIVAAVVAPAAFAVLPSRTLAGALVGRVLPALFWSGILIAGAAAALTWPLAGRPARLTALGAAAVACVVAQLVVAPRIAQIRDAVSGPMDALPPDDARRLAFGRLHGISVGMLGIAGLAALVALVLLYRAISARQAA